MKPIRRRIVGTHDSMNPGWQKSRFTGGSRILHLECGHEVRKKQSSAFPITGKVQCSDCTSLQKGTTRFKFHTERREAEVETWDASRGWPVRTMRPMTPEEIAKWCNEPVDTPRA